MPRVIGPTIPRWQLGEELARLREQADVTWVDAADALGCSESKIRKIEGGHVGVVRAELAALLELYKVDDERLVESLTELQKLGKQRGWWAQFGRLPSPFTTYLDLESTAQTIRIFETLMVHGLLQTEEYARAVADTVSLDEASEQERQAKIRLARQERVWNSDDAPTVWVILDEAALRRPVGGRRVMRDQLHHLLRMTERTELTFQVVPFRHGGHPGALGAFTIFEFDEHRHSPVVYVEGQAGSLYLEGSPDLSRCSLAYDHLTAAALSPPDSVELVEKLASAIEKEQS